MADDLTLTGLYLYNPTIVNNLSISSYDPTTLQLNWTTNPSGSYNFNILRAYDTNLFYKNIGSTTGYNYLDSGLRTDNLYYYSIQVNPLLSGQVLVVSGIQITSTIINENYSNITLSWPTPSSISATVISGYRIYRSIEWNNQFLSIGSTLTNTYIDSGLNNYQAYYYKITSLF